MGPILEHGERVCTAFYPRSDAKVEMRLEQNGCAGLLGNTMITKALMGWCFTRRSRWRSGLRCILTSKDRYSVLIFIQTHRNAVGM
jgi:hypothetical protein